MRLSFSTFACPTWTWEQIIDVAANAGYHGIEIRGIEDELFLPNARPFRSEHRQHSLEQPKGR